MGMGRKDGRVAGIQRKNPTDLVYNSREEEKHWNKKTWQRAHAEAIIETRAMDSEW